MTPAPTPYADADDTRTMRGDCRVAAVRMQLPDPRDRHLSPRETRCAPVATHDPQVDAAAARLAARLDL